MINTKAAEYDRRTDRQAGSWMEAKKKKNEIMMMTTMICLMRLGIRALYTQTHMYIVVIPIR